MQTVAELEHSTPRCLQVPDQIKIIFYRCIYGENLLFYKENFPTGVLCTPMATSRSATGCRGGTNVGVGIGGADVVSYVVEEAVADVR
jgi:hypothetical protein